jgi:predicted HTH transcriptional regulator
VDIAVRRAPGSASLERLDATGRPLAIKLVDVFAMLARYTQRPGAVSGAVRVNADRLPDAAVRESLVNACVHRDWAVPSDPPVSVDLAGDVLVVVSPGGFLPFGVNEDNVIRSPSRPRNRALADLARGMRLAEQEGTGVDRMCRELIFRGLPRPELQETPGMRVRCALSGGAPVRHVVDLVSRLSDVSTRTLTSRSSWTGCCTSRGSMRTMSHACCRRRTSRRPRPSDGPRRRPRVCSAPA